MIKKTGIWLVSFLAVGTLSAEKAWSWGDEGHEIVALVAQQILKTQSQNGNLRAANALKAVAAVLGDTTIDKAATWPDKIKIISRDCDQAPYIKNPDYGTGEKKGKSSALCEAYAYTASWHFVNTDYTEYVQPTGYGYSDGDLVILIKGLTHVLKGENAPGLAAAKSYGRWKAQCLAKKDHNCKKEALSFLIHFLGDIHQPLHAGALCDIGGNIQLITFFGEENDPAAFWCKGQPNPLSCHHELHQNWDTTMLLKDPGGDPFTTAANYANKLMATMTGQQASSDAKRCVTTPPSATVDIDGANGPADWVGEDACYMQQVYTFPDEDPSFAKHKKTNRGKRAVAQTLNYVPNRCVDSRKIGTGKNLYFSSFKVADTYYQTNIVTVNERLYWSGSRLATVLMNIYGDGDKIAELSPDGPSTP